MSLTRLSALALVTSLVVACAGPTTSPQPAPTPRPQGSGASRPVNPAQVERLQRLMVPLVRAMNSPKSLNEVRVGIVDDPQINAANAGGGFLATHPATGDRIEALRQL